jgi:hypothetical protein
LFVEAAILTTLSGILLYSLSRNTIISAFAAVLFGGWAIFLIPFDVYAYYATGLISFLFDSSITFSSNSDAGLSTVLQRPRYGLISIIPLLLAGIVGGFVTCKRLYLWIDSDKHGIDISVVLFLWGISIIIFAVMHIATGQIWLISRYLPLSLPLVIIGASIGLGIKPSQKIGKEYWRSFQRIMIIVIIISSFTSYILIAGSAWTDIHTYSSEELGAAEWASKHTETMVISDMSQSALVVSSSGSGRYPLNETSIQKLFYNNTIGKVPKKYVDYNLIITNEMGSDGFYIPPYPRESANPHTLSSLAQNNSVIYSNSGSRAVTARP